MLLEVAKKFAMKIYQCQDSNKQITNDHCLI